MNKIQELEARKEELQHKLHKLDLAYIKDHIDKDEYVDRKFDILDGRFEDDAFQQIDDQIAKAKQARTRTMTALSIAAVIVLLIPLAQMSGITSFAIFNPDGTATLAINETYTSNATKDLTFINTTSVQVSGEVYGYGEAWIYLVKDGQRKLVYYADTTGQQQLTGMVAGTAVNDTNTTNSTTNETETNTTANETETNETTNTTTNTTTNETTNQTDTNMTQTNSTVNQTEQNTTTNETSQTNETAADFSPEIVLEKSQYEVGDNISIEVLPNGSQYTLYMHAPDDTYILNKDYWIAQVSGNHTITGLITKDNQTERAEANFVVTQPQTATFTEACVETCSLAESQEVRLEIRLSGTSIKLDSVTYEPQESNATNTSNVSSSPSEETEDSLEGAKGRGAGAATPSQSRRCLHPNPNARPLNCFNETELEKRFPDKEFQLINGLGKTAAVLDGQGNLHIQGQVIENATGTPQQYDFTVGHGKNAAAWIDAVTGDLYLRGHVRPNQETPSWETRQDYIVSNRQGMYLAVFRADTGNLQLRGEVVQG